jgi:hypothetical protein
MRFKMASMRCNPIAVVLAFAVACVAFLPVKAAAQPMPLRGNSRVAIDYIDPRAPKSVATLDRLRRRQVLEELSQFLAPLRLPRILRVRTKSCGVVNAFYVPTEWAINICYEYFEYLEALSTRVGSMPGNFTRNDVIVGGFVDAVLHELGHALFDILQVPVFGREEDAADQMAGFLMLQFGPEVARTTIRGAAFTYLSAANPRTRTQFADEHGTASQRFFNYVCLGYGGAPEAFKEFVDRGLLPKQRASNCAREYKQVGRAFVKTILPHIDQQMMKQVQSRQWLRSTDGK